jgi:hypothetical protein
MSGQQSYAPGAVILTFAPTGFPPIVVTMMAKGTFVEIDFEVDAWADEVAADGQVVRILSADRRGTIKFSTNFASPSNPSLSAVAVADRLTRLATGPVSVTDPTGTSIAGCGVAWLKRIPKKPYATESSNIEWELRCPYLASEIGTTIPL